MQQKLEGPKKEKKSPGFDPQVTQYVFRATLSTSLGGIDFFS